MLRCAKLFSGGTHHHKRSLGKVFRVLFIGVYRRCFGRGFCSLDCSIHRTIAGCVWLAASATASGLVCNRVSFPLSRGGDLNRGEAL